MGIIIAIFIFILLIILIFIKLINFIKIIWKYKNKIVFNYFVKRNIPRDQQLREWTKKFGKIYLILEFENILKIKINYICSDPNILIEIFEKKQFDNFPERKNLNNNFPINEAHLFLASGNRWNDLRKNSSIFTNKNISSINQLIEESILNVLNEIKINVGKLVNFCDYSDLFFASLISRIAYSTAFPNNSLFKFSNKYINIAKNLIIKKEEIKNKNNLINYWFFNLFYFFNGKYQKKEQFGLFEVLYNKIKISEEKKINKDKIDNSINSSNRLEVTLGQLFLNKSIKIAGLQTISFVLSCIIHFISINYKIQEKLRLELQNLKEENKKDNFYFSSELLEAVINETLRLCPIVAFANTRKCNINYSSINGDIYLNIGDSIEADIFSIARNKEFWGGDSDKFRPERWFNLKYSQSSFFALLPFGYGPRRCVAILLAKTILKKVLAALILKYSLISMNGINKNEEPILEGKEILKPKNVFIKIEEINNNKE